MSAVFYVMAILGCGEADGACQQVDVARAQYASVAECQAATDGEIANRADLLFPVVVAQCRRADAKASATLSLDEVALPEAAPQPRTPVRMARLER